ncbi:MAG: hypothetical protein GY722_09525, partial [bacterium]|nr:hypothetical protein [bacterium]MCP5034300.1 hypothetical protein [Actinomycetes bacterium]
QLGDGSLANGQVDPEVEGSTGTGLDQIIDMINADTELSRRISNEDIRGGAESADRMNAIIVEAIKETGTANNGEFAASDIYALNAYIRANHLDTWTLLHGDDESSEETGYHRVQNDGAVARLFDQNGVNTVADGIYHLGFAIQSGRLLNEDGNRNASLEDVAVWLNSLLEEDLESGALVNPDVTPYVKGSTGTGLDQVVSLIMADPELNRRISIEEIAEGARAADELNGLIVEAIQATGTANDGEFTASDMHDVNAYLQANHQTRWTLL